MASSSPGGPAHPPSRHGAGRSVIRRAPFLAAALIACWLTAQVFLLHLHHVHIDPAWALMGEASLMESAQDMFRPGKREGSATKDNRGDTDGRHNGNKHADIKESSLGESAQEVSRRAKDLRRDMEAEDGKEEGASGGHLRQQQQEAKPATVRVGGRTNETSETQVTKQDMEDTQAKTEVEDTPAKQREASDMEETEEKPKEKLNILLLYGDDWRHDVFSAGGNLVVLTPHLNKLAEEGVLFTHNCVTTSICGISRATLQTGQYYSRHKCNPHQRGGYPRPEFLSTWNETLNGLLRDNGYYVGLVGKWQIKDAPRRSFDVFNEYYGFHVNGKGEHITELNERHSLAFLENRPKDKPFFLTVSFFATHALDNNPVQYIAQNRSMSLYTNVSVPVPPNGDDAAWKRLPQPVFKEHTEARSRWRQRYSTPEMFQHHMKNMYRMVTEVDSTSGAIMKKLEEQGVLDNTLIIFTTDNGNIHGEHGIAEKWFPHQESIRVPLVIKDPRMPSEKLGTTNSDLTLNVDLAPTIVSAAGIDVPARMQGRDISEIYVGGDQREAWRQHFHYEHPEIDCDTCIPGSEAVVVKDPEKYLKLMRWTAPNILQFFDLNADPIEENDLYNSNNTEHKDQISTLMSLLVKLRKAAK